MELKKKVTIHANNYLSLLSGKRWNVSYVMEYPKCGGTWVSELLRTYIGVNKLYGKTKLIRRNAIVQRHELPHPYHVNPIVVIRDPRDVLTSFYFFETYLNREANPSLLDRIGFDTADSDANNLVKYIKSKLTEPHLSEPKFSYSEFINRWWELEHKHIVSYEGLKKDAVTELRSMLEFLNVPVDEEKVRATVESKAFNATSKGRKEGSHDPYSFRRKGIVGDWKNYFTEEAVALTKEHIGDLLIKMKYEEDLNWSL